jgi:hypothetical protein
MSTPVRTPERRQSTDPWRQRVDSGDWNAITAEVNEDGGALLPQLLRQRFRSGGQRAGPRLVSVACPRPRLAACGAASLRRGEGHRRAACSELPAVPATAGHGTPRAR